MKEIREIRTDHIDDENVQYVDVYFDDDDNSAGKTVAVVCLDTLKTFYYDNDYRVNVRVKEAIKEILNERTVMFECEECGGKNIQTKGWVKPNENNKFVDLVSEEIGDNWCEDCEENVNLVSV